MTTVLVLVYNVIGGIFDQWKASFTGYPTIHYQYRTIHYIIWAAYYKRRSSNQPSN